MSYGVTPAGFIRKSYDTLLSEMQTKAQSAEFFGESIDLSDESPIGAEIKLMAWALSNQWQLAEDVYYSFDIDVAEGVSLNRLVALGQVQRKDGQPAGGYLCFTGDPQSPISRGTQAETEQGVIFETIVFGATNDEGVALIATKCLEVGVAGNVPAGSINKIKTPVAGILTVTNPSGFTDGRSVESDYELKERYRSTQLASGSALAAIRGGVLNISGVTQAIGYENIENYVDANGLPAGAIELIVSGGDDDTIAKIILSQKPAGINTFGNISRTVMDTQEKEHIIKFSRPEEIQGYIRYVLSVNSEFDPEYEATIKSTAVEFINNLEIASTAYSWKLCSLLQDIQGVENVQAFMGFTSGFAILDKITPGIRQILKTALDKVVIIYE